MDVRSADGILYGFSHTLTAWRPWRPICYVEVSMNRLSAVRRLVICVLLLLALAVTGGCARRAGISSVRQDTAGSYGMQDQDSSKSTSKTPTAESNTTGSSPADRKIIFTVSVALDVADAEKSFKNAEALAARYGGYVAQSSLQRTDAQVRATAVLRVPVTKVSQLMDEMTALGTVTDRSSGSEDVTSAYIDLQARLKVLRAEEEQLVTFLKKATTIKDMLAIQEQLRTVRTEIEQYEGQQRYMDNATSLATINVQLVQTTAAFVAPRGFGSAFVQSLVRFGQGLASFWTWIGASLVFIVFYGALASGLCWLVLRFVRRHARKDISAQG